jgi:hypothetical protein
VDTQKNCPNRRSFIRIIDGMVALLAIMPITIFAKYNIENKLFAKTKFLQNATGKIDYSRTENFLSLR